MSVNVFSMKVLIGNTIVKSSTGDGTATLCGHLSHAKVQPLEEQREYLHFSVIDVVGIVTLGLIGLY